jgi:hypothetical protein
VEVEYRLSEADLIAFQKHRLARLPLFNRFCRALLPAFVLLGVLGAVWYGRQGAFEHDLTPLLPLGLMVLVFAWHHRVSTPEALARRMIKQSGQADIFGKQRMTLSAQAFSNAKESAVRASEWAALEKIEVLKDHAFFYVSKNRVHLLPRRAFAREHEFDVFVATARLYHEQGLAARSAT